MSKAPHSASPFATESAAHLLSDASRAFKAGSLDEAEALCRKILASAPNDPLAIHLLGMIAFRIGRRGDALRLLQKSIALRQDVPEFHSNLAALWGHLGHSENAATVARRALELKPEDVDAHANLAAALLRLGELDHAEKTSRRVVELAPSWPQAHLRLGEVLRLRGELNEAATAYRRALELGGPSDPAILNGCGTAFEEMGQAREALSWYRRAAAAAEPTDARAWGNLLYALHYDPACPPDELSRMHREWARRYADAFTAAAQSHPNGRDPNRRLRIGYVSADFRGHSVAAFLEPLVTHRDGKQFDVVCYSDVQRPDDVTSRFKAASDLWRDVRGITDESLARLIREDQVDVLVDPCGAMGDGRPLLFARKPAPVQVAYSGYPGSMGMSAIDYFLTDDVQHPLKWEQEATAVESYVERLARVGTSPRVYRPPDEGPEVLPPPVLRNVRVTFGSLNRPNKHSDVALRLWAEVLRRVPGSRLLVLGGSANDDQATQIHGPQF